MSNALSIVWNEGTEKAPPGLYMAIHESREFQLVPLNLLAEPSALYPATEGSRQAPY